MTASCCRGLSRLGRDGRYGRRGRLGRWWEYAGPSVAPSCGRHASPLHAVTDQDALLNQLLHDFFHEKRRAFGLLQNELFEGL